MYSERRICIYMTDVNCVCTRHTSNEYTLSTSSNPQDTPRVCVRGCFQLKSKHIYLFTMKPLIVLDPNGLFVDRIHRTKGRFLTSEFHFMTPNGYYVFVRPHTRMFIRFLFRHFDVAICSSMKRHNVIYILERIFSREQRDQLYFVHTDLKKNTSVHIPMFCRSNMHRDHELKKLKQRLSINLQTSGQSSCHGSR